MDSTPSDQNDQKSEGAIPTNLRLLLLLEELAQSGLPTTPTELNAKLGLPKPTVHRLFHTLEAEGFVQRDIDGKSYSPGRRLRRLSASACANAWWRESMNSWRAATTTNVC